MIHTISHFISNNFFIEAELLNITNPRLLVRQMTGNKFRIFFYHFLLPNRLRGEVIQDLGDLSVNFNGDFYNYIYMRSISNIGTLAHKYSTP